MEDKFDAIYFYEQVSGIYDRDTHELLTDPSGAYAHQFASLVATLNPSSILEIGCGTCKRLRALAYYYQKNNLKLPRYVAIEPGEGMRKQIPDEVRDKMEILADPDTSGFSENEFDMTLSSGVLCSVYSQDAAKIAKECYRIAKKFTFHTDVPKDRPHLNDLDLLKFFNNAGADIVYFDKRMPYPYPGECEHHIIVRKTGDLKFAEDFPIRSKSEDYDETWQEIISKRINS